MFLNEVVVGRLREQVIIEEINFLIARQFSFRPAIERANDEIKWAEDSIKCLDDEIKGLEDDLWWLEFIRFCNTSCWRFKL